MCDAIMTDTFRGQDRVEPISGSEPKKSVSFESGDEFDASKAKFDAAVQNADPSQVTRASIVPSSELVAIEASKKQSLLELAATRTQIAQVPPPTAKDLADQATNLRQQMQRPHAVLLEERPYVDKIPSDAQNTLSAHIEHVDQGVRDASKMAGIVEAGAISATTEKSPAIRFLSYLTESDKRLGSFVDELKGLKIGEKGQKLSPETLFAVQIKLNFVQQELEFFTTTLNKSLESTKTLMNVQI